MRIIPRTFATILWVVLCGNSGGIFNLFLYGPLLINEVRREKKKQRKLGGNKRKIEKRRRKSVTMNKKANSMIADDELSADTSLHQSTFSIRMSFTKTQSKYPSQISSSGLVIDD